MAMQFGDIALLGIRFRPTDEELIVDYLAAKETNKSLRSNLIVDYDVYSCPPWLLPSDLFEYSGLQNDMYFISERRRKTEGSSKVDRNAGAAGFWYYNSKRIPIKNCYGEVIGIKCSLNYMIFKVVENNNKKKKKEKTSWIMHEYTLQSSHRDPTKFQDVVLCHIYNSAEDKQPKRITIIDEEEEEEEKEAAAQLEVGANQLAFHQNTPVFSSASLCTSPHSNEPLPQMSQHDHTYGDDSLGNLNLLNMTEFETMLEEVNGFLSAEDPSNRLV